MELVDVARVLSRRPFLIAAGALVALALAFFLGGGATAAPGAVATTRVTLDTPKSQLITVKKQGADTLLWRASLLADLMASETTMDGIAKEVGVPRDQIAIVDPFLAEPTVPTPLARAATEAAAITGAPNVLTVNSVGDLPIITIEAAAPSADVARRLAEAATHSLEAEASPVHTVAIQGFSVQQISPIAIEMVPAGHGPIVAIIGSFVFFCFWCAAVAIAPALLRTWRAAIRMQHA